MKKSQNKQYIVLSATVLTLVLGAVFTYFRPTHQIPIWPLVLLLGLIWGMIAVWVLWQARRNQ